jgi:hypothetical protein
LSSRTGLQEGSSPGGGESANVSMQTSAGRTKARLTVKDNLACASAIKLNPTPKVSYLERQISV